MLRILHFIFILLLFFPISISARQKSYVFQHLTLKDRLASDKIYQPFFTTKPTSQETGLGLSLSYDIMTKGHGGEMRVNTKEEEGAEFIVQLPAGKLKGSDITN